MHIKLGEVATIKYNIRKSDDPRTLQGRELWSMIEVGAQAEAGYPLRRPWST